MHHVVRPAECRVRLTYVIGCAVRVP
jgi:hypothetical protein